ncbi:3-dehydroquinate synthase [Brevibacillus ginsengisoli]|uniref:3-dehydroquinate synthase n=1 Tax=Brevibacillus ginsengisoli TaxID=363854 RepID=UPI003CE8CA77
MKMKRLPVELAERSYPILIGEGLLNQVGSLLQERGVTTANRLFILTDSNVAPLYLDRLTRHLESHDFKVFHYIVDAGEKAKQLAIYEKVMTAAIEAGLDRHSIILALGGGVVGDLAGFVAATYMRGIRFVQLPTTLLAHDSSVGGKVAINHPLGKNLIGAFHQPIAVIYDTNTLTTLPKREVAAGYAEVVKHGLLADASFVKWLEQNAEALNSLSNDPVAEAIYRGCQIKAEIVSADETEQGKRALLNLGHTFGHAFEALSHYSELNHGEAISIGMGLAAEVAEQLGIAPKGTAQHTRDLLQKFQLPVHWPKQYHPREVLDVMKRDKKNYSGKLVLVLPVEIGKAEIYRDIEEKLVLQVMQNAQEGAY